MKGSGKKQLESVGACLRDRPESAQGMKVGWREGGCLTSRQVQEPRDKRSKALKAGPHQILKSREMKDNNHTRDIYHSAEANDQWSCRYESRARRWGKKRKPVGHLTEQNQFISMSWPPVTVEKWPHLISISSLPPLRLESYRPGMAENSLSCLPPPVTAYWPLQLGKLRTFHHLTHLRNSLALTNCSPNTWPVRSPLTSVRCITFRKCL